LESCAGVVGRIEAVRFCIAGLGLVPWSDATINWWCRGDRGQLCGTLCCQQCYPPNSSRFCTMGWRSELSSSLTVHAAGYSTAQCDCVQYRACSCSSAHACGSGLVTHHQTFYIAGCLADAQVYQAMLQLLSHPSLDLPASVSSPLSAGTAGFCLSFVLSPAELIKARKPLPLHVPLPRMHAMMHAYGFA
jgi:hypothetical protein